MIEAKCGMVKIGCSDFPRVRLETIKTHSPVPVRLIAQWPGDSHDERRVHKRFSECRSHNEWFVIEGAVAEFVEAIRGTGLDAIADWDEIRWKARKGVSDKTRELRSTSMKRVWAEARKDPQNAGLMWRARCPAKGRAA